MRTREGARATKEHGCLYWCGMFFLGMLAVGLAIYALGIVLAAAVGVGAWLGVRYVWRALVREAPNSTIVDLWINRPPIARKLAMGVVSVALALLMMVGYYGALNEMSSEARSEASDSNPAVVAPAMPPSQDSADS